MKTVTPSRGPGPSVGCCIPPPARSAVGLGVRLKVSVLALTAGCLLSGPGVMAQAPAAAPLESLPALQVPPYMGTWYQVALFPNVFQRQCVSDTTATYRQLPDGTVEVLNRCRTADGRMDDATGNARATGTLSGTSLAPAQLKVSFLPAWLRWMPVGWGAYWVIQLADDGRYAVISEPSRQYLWILSRQPRLTAADEAAIRARLAQQGFSDLSKLQMHRHGDAAPAPKP